MKKFITRQKDWDAAMDFTTKVLKAIRLTLPVELLQNFAVSQKYNEKSVSSQFGQALANLLPGQAPPFQSFI